MNRSHPLPCFFFHQIKRGKQVLSFPYLDWLLSCEMISKIKDITENNPLTQNTFIKYLNMMLRSGKNPVNFYNSLIQKSMVIIKNKSWDSPALKSCSGAVSSTGLWFWMWNLSLWLVRYWCSVTPYPPDSYRALTHEPCLNSSTDQGRSSLVTD